MATRGVQLPVVVLRDMHGVAGETGALPDEAARFGEELGDFAGDELVGDGFLGVGVYLRLVAHFPGAACGSVVICFRLLWCLELRFQCVERVSVFVFCGADVAFAAGGVDHVDGVVGAVDVGVDAHAEKVLVVVGVYAGVDFCAPAVEVFAFVAGEGVEDAGEFYFELDGAVLVEDPVDAVFVVCGGEDVGYDEFAGSCDGDGVVTEIGVLEEDTGVFFVDAYGVFDRGCRTGFIDECCIHVVNCAFAVTAQAERVGHVSTTVFSQIECVFPLVRVFRVSIWDDHFGKRQSPECVSLSTLVVERDVRKDETLAVVEANMQLPILPANNSSIYRKRDTLWLCDIYGLDVCSEAALLLDRCGMIVVGRRLVDRSSNGRNIDMDYFLSIGIVYGREIERVAVLAVIDMWTVVHESLLKTNLGTESFVITNGPGFSRSAKASINAVHDNSRSQYTLCISSGGIPMIPHCSMTLGSLRTIVSTIWRSSMVI